MELSSLQANYAHEFQILHGGTQAERERGERGLGGQYLRRKQRIPEMGI